MVRMPTRWVRRFREPERRDEEIGKQYLAGRRLEDIGLEFGLSATRVSQIAAAAGLPPRQRPKPEAEEVARLHRDEGLSQWALSKRFGVSIRVIGRMLRSQGIGV